jgi:hypothetical protein
MNHLTHPPFLLLLTSPPAHHCALHQPCNTLLLHSTIFDHCALDKQSKSSHIHVHTQNPCCTSTYYVHSTYSLFGGLSLLYLQYLLTYFFFFFWFYLSSVVEVKGKRERLLFVKLLQSSLPLATTHEQHSKALLTLSLLARAPRHAAL